MSRTVRGFGAAVLGLGVWAVACASGQATVDETPTWLRYDASREVLSVAPGTTVEIHGSGSLAFVDGRRGIRAADLTPFNDAGTALQAGPVRSRRVLLRAASGEVRWTLYPVPEPPEASGTRIRDGNSAEATARIDAASETTFYLTIRPDGQSEFFEPDTSERAKDAARLQSILDRYAGYGLSAVVAFSEQEGRPPMIVATGTRDGSADGVAMSGETLFELGSLTKQLTAAAILKLQAAGRLSVEDSLAAWDADLPAAVRGIRLRQILLHTSGLPENVEVGDDDSDAVWRALETLTPEFSPGTDWRYSNFGYTVLAAIVERTSPDGYIGFVEDSLIAPSGVADIGLPQRHAWSAGRMAVGGSGPLGTGKIAKRWPARARGWNDLLGASGAVATMPALHDWFRALWGGRVLSPRATREMFEEQPPEIAYGWFYMRGPDSTVHIAHGGDTEGTQTFVTFTPATEELVVLGVNDKRGWRGTLLHAIPIALDADSLPALPPPVATGVVSTQRLTGTYVLADGAELEISTAGNHVLVGARGASALAMLTGADSALASRMRSVSDSTARFLEALVRGDSATVRAILAPSGRSASFWNVWAHLAQGHATAPTGFELLGTIPERAGRLVCFSKIFFATGQETLRLVWRPRLDGWGTGGELPARSFWPTDEKQLVSFDPTRDGWVSLRLVGESEGTDGLVLEDQSGRRAVRRLTTPSAAGVESTRAVQF